MPERGQHQTLLAFDVGTRHTGVAIGNTLSATARALSVLDARVTARLFDSIGALVREWQPDALVVGRPLHPDGTPHAMTARSERFARQLQGRFGKPVALVDERYSTVEAHALNDASKPVRVATGAKRDAQDRADAESAAVILRQYLSERAGQPAPAAASTPARTESP